MTKRNKKRPLKMANREAGSIDDYDSWRKNVSTYDRPKAPAKYGRCYESHPPLKLGGYEIYGGSCLNPVVKDADVYVALEGSWKPKTSSYPWEPSPVVEFLFKIVDMSVPSSVTDFKALLKYLQEQLEAGKKVHVGCIGGHGRTGMVFSALASQMMPDLESPTEYVRKNYCHKAVESAHQVQWLHQHFGIKTVLGAKESLKTKPKGGALSLVDVPRSSRSPATSTGNLSKTTPTPMSEPRVASEQKYQTNCQHKPLPGPESIWWKTPNYLTPTVRKIV